MYSVEKVIRQGDGRGFVYDYFLKNDFDISVAVFHNEKLACRVRDLLNGDGDG